MDDSMTVSEARSEFAEAVNRVAFAKDRIVVTRRNKKLAALVPIEDLEMLEAIEDAADAEEVARILADPDPQWIPWEQVKERLDELDRP